MFIRKKLNKSGVIGIQIIDKSTGRYRAWKTVGSSGDPSEINILMVKVRHQLSDILGADELKL